MRLIFMGTPAFAIPVLKQLLAAGHEVLCVYTQPPRPAGRGQRERPSLIHQLALENQLPVHTPTSLRSPEIQAEFAAFHADAAVVAAYGLLLPAAILTACPYGCINIHPSLLPRWRGAAPIHRPLLAGDTETGVTIMQMDAGLDTGDMLLQEKITIKEDDTSETLHDRLAELGATLTVRTLTLLEKNTITPVKQQEEGVTYAAKLTKAEGHINWQLPAADIERMIRAFTPWPGAYFIYKGEMIKILKAEYKEGTPHATPGTVLDNALSTACGNGILHPLLLQRPGRTVIEREIFLRGFQIEPGERLG